MSKTVHAISAVLVTVFGSLAAFHWSDIVSPTVAADIVVGLGVAKTILTFVAPSAPATPAS